MKGGQIKNRSVVNTYTIFNGHIGAGYREIQEVGVHRRDLQTLSGVVGSRNTSKDILSTSTRTGQGFEPNSTIGPDWRFSDPLSIMNRESES